MSPETRPRGTCLSRLLLALLAGSVAFSAFGQPSRDFSAVEIEVLPVQGDVYMLVGAGGNITVQVGADGVVVVDSMFAELSGKVLAAIRELSDQPIRYVINTHVHGDHTGGNANLARAGSTITGGNVTRAIADSGEGARIVAHENVLLRLAEQQPAVPFDAWPTDTFFTGQKDLFVNGEAVQLLHQPAAHTDGDSLVFFRRSDVISTGDVFVTTLYPFIDRARGGSINGIIDALNRIIQLAVPAAQQEGGTLVVPGHGRICDEADVVEYRDMLTIIRDRVQHMIESGMSLQQVQLAGPTMDYDARYGADSGFWTTEQFVEAVYLGLSESNEQ